MAVIVYCPIASLNPHECKKKKRLTKIHRDLEIIAFLLLFLSLYCKTSKQMTVVAFVRFSDMLTLTFILIAGSVKFSYTFS